MFKEAKWYCAKLIVFLQEDPSIDRPEKHKPIMSIEERVTILSGIKYIDEIEVYTTEEDLLVRIKNLKSTNSDLIRIIGDDWRTKRFTGDELPIPVIFNTRAHNYSSTELRRRIQESPI
jgi:glycerol-3-phosphate cytidylyltransferase